MRVWILQSFREFGRRLVFVLIFRSGTLPKIIKNNFRFGISFRRLGLVLKILSWILGAITWARFVEE